MKSILMVDDVATNLICAAEVLRNSYEVSTAKSGRQALLMLKEMTPDLIMLDINMPQMDGYEVFEKILSNPEWASIPVVFLTAEADMANEARGLEMGAMDFIRKPFDPEVMKARIDKILSISDQKKELQFVANRDSLTNLPTRKTLENYMNLSTNKEGYFLLLDLDNFKSVNDNFGHIVGDSVLIKLSQVFEEVVGDNERVCRLGGDEFAMFLSGELLKEDVRNIVRRLIATTEYEISDILADFSDFRVSISVGIACRPSDGETFQELYANADKALYFVKQNGKRGYHFFDYEENKDETFEEENTKIDLLGLQRLICENDKQDGAYKVEYEGFKRIYRFVSRCLDRKDEDIQIVLFTLSFLSDNKDENLKDFIQRLGNAVSNSLRRGDVATQCGDCQYVVILMDANEDNGRKVSERIKDKFYKSVKDESVKLLYEIETVKGGSK